MAQWKIKIKMVSIETSFYHKTWKLFFRILGPHCVGPPLVNEGDPSYRSNFYVYFVFIWRNIIGLRWIEMNYTPEVSCCPLTFDLTSEHKQFSISFATTGQCRGHIFGWKASSYYSNWKQLGTFGYKIMKRNVKFGLFAIVDCCDSCGLKL